MFEKKRQKKTNQVTGISYLFFDQCRLVSRAYSDRLPITGSSSNFICTSTVVDVIDARNVGMPDDHVVHLAVVTYRISM